MNFAPATIDRLTVRTAAVADAKAIAEVNARGWRENYAEMLPASLLDTVEPRPEAWVEWLASAGAGTFVAELSGVVIGFCASGAQRSEVLLRQGFSGEIRALYVDRAVQRRGAGRALMASAMRTLREQGLGSLALWTLKENRPARRFYSGLGGQLVDTRKDRRGNVVLEEVAFGWSAQEAARLGERPDSPEH